MKYKRIIYEPGRVARIRLNRPQQLNALSNPHMKELEEAFDHAAEDPECRVIVLSGEGRAFCVGHDAVPTSPENRMMADGTTREQLIAELGSESAADHRFRQEGIYLVHEVPMRKWRNILKPMIAMVHGHVIYGGFLLAASMDLVFAAEDALFLPSLVNMYPGPWDFNVRKTKEILFEHRFITAREAHDLGFVSRIYPDRDALEHETLAYAHRVADNALHTYSIANVKRGLNMTMDLAGFASARDYAIGLHHRAGPLPEAEARELRSAKGVARASVALQNLKSKQEADEKYYPEK